MASPTLTPEQIAAVEITGRSVLVTAAAGSGKTTVLAQRCAHLVCDAAPQARCDVDQLLVLTFTDAAAAEMRGRIVGAIRARLQDAPGDARLRDQCALIDAAQISTIHAFCLWLIRRHFSALGIDPTAAPMDADEAALLKRETLDSLFSDLYRAGADRAPLGDASPPGFLELVDAYGLGDDRDIGDLVLKLHEFTTSLPDPNGWLDAAVTACGPDAAQTVETYLFGLACELSDQAEHAERLARSIRAEDSFNNDYTDIIEGHAVQLRSWRDRLAAGSGMDSSSSAMQGEDFQAVRAGILDYELPKLSGGAKRTQDLRTKAARERARAHRGRVKALFDSRVRDRYALFSLDEWTAALRETAGYVDAVVGLVRAFGVEYAARKRKLDVLDFSDLERFAFELLHEPGNLERPSEIARALHERFAHVLVDEFQDINPLQQALIHLASHESDPNRTGNLFAVGDVKQSIYRFRLAEPEMFTTRLHAFRADCAIGTALTLQSNFRSRPEIIGAVNLVFRALMRGDFGGVAYDELAELRPGRPVESAGQPVAVELHLLEREWDEHEAVHDDDLNDDEASTEQRIDYLADPARWSAMEREGYLIATRIQELRRQHQLSGTPLAHRDIVVLLRATRVSAERIALMLRGMGIPAYSEASGSLLDAVEVRDVIAALEVLDNAQQDYPLTAVLRSGLFGAPCTDDELTVFRGLDRMVPFHDCVRRYAVEGTDAALREKIATVLSRIEHYRIESRNRPLPDLLWRLYEERGHLAHAGGLLHGAQRRANLLRLHDLARKFSTFRSQGVHRFLVFLKSLDDEERALAAAAPLAESEDVVRVMSIHQSKGLEFPVVFLAGLGARFNLGDRSGRMIFERHARIGLCVVDQARMIEYPSAAHHLAAAEIERCTREEELRILYVAMTRARDRLILVGTTKTAELEERLVPDAASADASRLSLCTAMNALDWLIPTLGPMGLTASRVGANNTQAPRVDVHIHRSSDMVNWRLGRARDPDHAAQLQAVAEFAPLPASEPLEPSDRRVDEVLARVRYLYPSLASTNVRAVQAAGAFKGTFNYTHSPEDGSPQRMESVPGVVEGDQLINSPGTNGRDAAARRGVATHRLLQHLDFAAATGRSALDRELERIASSGALTHEEAALIDLEDMAWFLATPLAETMRAAGARLRREFQFIALEPLSTFDRTIVHAVDDRVLVRGIVDGIIEDDASLEIVDFKTDQVDAIGAESRAERYRPQIELYARAAIALWRKPVRAGQLVFLQARTIVGIDRPGGRSDPHSR